MSTAEGASQKQILHFIDTQNVGDPLAIFAGIFGTAMDAIITVDSQQRVVLFNPAAEQAFGYGAEEVLGKPLDLLIPAAFREAHREHVHRFGASGTTVRSMHSPGLVSGLRADGAQFPIEATISQTQANGQKYYTVILRDVSEREQAAEELQRHQRIISELSTPVLQVREHLLIVPIVGEIDTQRARQLTEQLLRNIRSRRARAAVIDLTGVASVDATVANHIVMTAEAARLLGARVIVTGISRAIAQTLVQLGSDFTQLITSGDLQSGIEEAGRLLGLEAAA